MWRYPFPIVSLSTILVVLFLASPSAAQSSPVAVALSERVGPTGSIYGPVGIPVVSESGHVAFIAGNNVGIPEGVFAGLPGAIQTVALSGSAAPAGGTFSRLSSQNVVVNVSGQVAFYSELIGGNSTGGSFVGVPGAIQTVALLGANAAAGGTYASLGTPALNATGRVAFASGLTTSGGGYSEGIFTGVPGTLQTVALRGNPSPAGSNYQFLMGNAMNGSGQVAFHTVLGNGQMGILVGTAGSLQTVAMQGSVAPGGGNFGSLNAQLALNGSGQVAFRAALTGSFSTNGIFVGAPGAVQAVARQFTPAPSGGNYDNPTNPLINASGQVAFYSTLSSGSSASGIFVGAPGAMRAAALQGTTAPGGGTFSSFDSRYLALNASGQVVFLGRTTVSGLYAGSPGSLVRLVAEGDLVELTPGGESRRVAVNGIVFNVESRGEDGAGLAFTDAGLLTYRLTFTDGTTGIFVSQIAPVPEPAAYLAVACCLTSALYVGRRVIGTAGTEAVQNLSHPNHNCPHCCA